MKKIIFKGCATALVTPFTQNGEKVDFKAYQNLIDEQINAGIDALVVLGTTGEPSTMTQEECDDVVKFAINHINGRVPVIVGAGSNSTKQAINKCIRYEQLGADALLVVTPYYNKCTQSGLISHYTQIAKATSLPIILYNVPGRTGVNLLPKTILELSKLENIVAVKEASGNIEQISEIKRLCKDDIQVYSGDDGLTLPILAVGGIGVISVASNVVPKKMTQLCSTFFDGEITRSREIQFELNPLIKSLFLEVNPIPVKTALSMLGKMSGTLRLPLSEMQQENIEKLKIELEKFF